MSNPYQSPNSEPGVSSAKTKIHPDWSWMTNLAYVLCIACMFGITGNAKDPSSSVIGVGQGFIRAPALLGDLGFKLAIPFLAVLPTAIVAVPFRRFYRWVPESRDMSMINFGMIIAALTVALTNASLYSAN